MTASLMHYILGFQYYQPVFSIKNEVCKPDSLLTRIKNVWRSSFSEHIIFSSQIGAIKPHGVFFTLAFEQFDIVPDETIYIDDLPENIPTRKRISLLSFCCNHRKHHRLIERLEKHTSNYE